MPALSVKKRSQRGENHFWRAFLACRLGLELFARPHNDLVIRISSKLMQWSVKIEFVRQLVGQAPPYQFQEIAIPARRSESRTGFARGRHKGLRRPFDCAQGRLTGDG